MVLAYMDLGKDVGLLKLLEMYPPWFKVKNTLSNSVSESFLGSDWYKMPKSSELWVSEVPVYGILSLFGCTSWPLEKKNKKKKK